MGELILCTGQVAANSYYIEEASLNIYSLEELSFYIYNNAYLLDEGFANPGLIRWISDEIKDKRLANDLLMFLEEDAKLNVFIGHILRSNGYLTKTEIKKCLDIISSFEGKTEAEARKIRADHLFKDGRLGDAVFSYEMILDKKLPVSDRLKGDILHNLGCALCGLFFFEKASDHFELAYRLNRNPDSLESLLHSCLAAENNEKYSLMVDRYQVLPEDEERIRENYQNILELQEKEGVIPDMIDRLSLAKDEVEREFILADIMGDLKQNYRNLRTF